MSATDELRRLLDERGVEHNDRDPKPGYETPWSTMVTVWNNGSKRPVRYQEWLNGTTRLDAGGVSAEQAVEATLGRGTCQFKTVIDQDPSPRHRGDICECGECGYRCARGFIVDERFNYCPSCGRRIVEVDK